MLQPGRGEKQNGKRTLTKTMFCRRSELALVTLYPPNPFYNLIWGKVDFIFNLQGNQKKTWKIHCKVTTHARYLISAVKRRLGVTVVRNHIYERVWAHSCRIKRLQSVIENDDKNDIWWNDDILFSTPSFFFINMFLVTINIFSWLSLSFFCDYRYLWWWLLIPLLVIIYIIDDDYSYLCWW